MVDAERMGRARFKTLGLIAIVLLAATVVSPAIRARVRKVLRPKQEVAARVDELGPAARARLRAGFGHAGPKLREGDMQVPEGVYAVESLNPNSMYHVALRVGYPSRAARAARR